MEAIELINYIHSPASKVYQALVTEEGLREIWTPKLKVKPELGHVNEFDFDEGYITKLNVEKLDENRWVEWKCVESDPEWKDMGISFELTEKEGVTTVLLRHYDWRELTDFFRWCNYNWAMFLRRLKHYCEA